jgi:hypothetical protein
LQWLQAISFKADQPALFCLHEFHNFGPSAGTNAAIGRLHSVVQMGLRANTSNLEFMRGYQHFRKSSSRLILFLFIFVAVNCFIVLLIASLVVLVAGLDSLVVSIPQT